MRPSTRKLPIQTLFIIVQIILYVIFLFLDLSGGSLGISSKIKYSIIILCFCYSLSVRKSDLKSTLFHLWHSRKLSVVLLLQTALFFTVISDLFILIFDIYFYGVLTFIIVQQFYGLRLILWKSKSETVYETGIANRREYGKRYMIRLFFQLLSAMIVCLLLLLCRVELEALLIASVFYFICILSNTTTAISLALRRPRVKGNILYAAGMVLFLLCDVNVGLFNLSGFITLPAELYSVIYGMSSILMWTFYAPAQVLIAISCHYEEHSL